MVLLYCVLLADWRHLDTTQARLPQLCAATYTAFLGATGPHYILLSPLLGPCRPFHLTTRSLQALPSHYLDPTDPAPSLLGPCTPCSLTTWALQALLPHY